MLENDSVSKRFGGAKKGCREAGRPVPCLRTKDAGWLLAEEARIRWSMDLLASRSNLRTRRASGK